MCAWRVDGDGSGSKMGGGKDVFQEVAALQARVDGDKKMSLRCILEEPTARDILDVGSKE